MRGAQVDLERQTSLAQALQHGKVFGHGQELFDARRNLGTDALALGNILFARQDELVNRQESLGDDLAHALAHMADAQGKQHTPEWLALGLVELGDDFLGRLEAYRNRIALLNALFAIGARVHAPRIQACDVINRELVEVCDIVDQAGSDHLVDDLVAQAINVHAAAAHPVEQALLELRRAVNGHAAVGNLAILVNHGATTHGADLGHVPVDRIGRALVEHRAHDLGNHVARLVHDDGVALAHVFATDLVDVVQRGARDGGAGYRHRVELGDRREHAGTTHLDANLAQDGLFFLGRELKGDGPARCAGGKAQVELLLKAVHLYDHAVDVVVQVAAMLERLGAELVNLSGCGATGNVGVDAKAGATQPVQELALAVDVQRIGIGNGVDKGSQVAARRDLGVLLAQAAGGGVARVGKGVAALGIGLFIQTNKAALGHVHLAAYLNGTLAVDAHVGERRLGQVHGHILDGTDIERHILARGAVAARGGAHKGAVLIGKRHAQTVDLKLAGIGDAAGTERILGALEPRIKFVQIHSIVHGIHARHMCDRCKLLAHVAAHALGIAVGRHQVGVGRLDLLQLNEHFVKGGVRDLGRIEHVVAIGVVIELVAQLGRTRCRLGTGIGRCSGIRARGRFGIDVHAVTKQARLLHSGTPSLDFKRIQEYHRSPWGRIAVSNRTESAAIKLEWIARSNHALAVSK